MHAANALERAHVWNVALSGKRAIHAESELAKPALAFALADDTQYFVELGSGIFSAGDATAFDDQRDGIGRYVEAKRGVGEAVDFCATMNVLEIARLGEDFADRKLRCRHYFSVPKKCPMC